MDSTPEEIAAEIHALVEAGRVPAARKRLESLMDEQRADVHLAGWVRVLALPVGRPGKPGRGSIEKDSQWLDEHAHEYEGEWVALREGELLGHHEDIVELDRELKEKGQREGALFVCLRSH